MDYSPEDMAKNRQTIKGKTKYKDGHYSVTDIAKMEGKNPKTLASQIQRNPDRSIEWCIDNIGKPRAPRKREAKTEVKPLFDMTAIEPTDINYTAKNLANSMNERGATEQEITEAIRKRWAA